MVGRQIARVEAARLARSPGTWLAGVGVLAVLAAGTALPALLGLEGDPAIGSALLLGPGVDIVLPLVVIVFGYPAVAGHRARGSIAVFLSAPADRGRVLLALWLARAVVLGALTIGALLGAVATIWGLYGAPPVRPVAGFAGLTVLAVLCLTSIAVGVSAAVRRPVRALAILVAGFVLAYGLWEPMVELGYEAIADPGSAEPPWQVRGLLLANPLESYGSAAHATLPPSPHFSVDVGGETASATQGERVGSRLPWIGLVGRIAIMVAWAGGVLAIGYLRLSRAEFR